MTTARKPWNERSRWSKTSGALRGIFLLWLIIGLLLYLAFGLWHLAEALWGLVW